MKWYSATIRRASMIGDEGIDSFWDSVFLLSATDRDSAWNAALEIGLGLESKYQNAAQERVRFAFVGVLYLDEVGESIESGVEVFFNTIEFEQPISVSSDVVFHPSSVLPKSLGIGVELPEC